jgi:hypothetical protein
MMTVETAARHVVDMIECFCFNIETDPFLLKQRIESLEAIYPITDVQRSTYYIRISVTCSPGVLNLPRSVVLGILRMLGA